MFSTSSNIGISSILAPFESVLINHWVFQFYLSKKLVTFTDVIIRDMQQPPDKSISAMDF